jgi:hypothetical protein
MAFFIVSSLEQGFNDYADPHKSRTLNLFVQHTIDSTEQYASILLFPTVADQGLTSVHGKE